MNLEEMKRIADARTKGEWEPQIAWESASGIARKAGCAPKYLSSISGDRLTEAEVRALRTVEKDAEFIAMAANNWDYIFELASQCSFALNQLKLEQEVNKNLRAAVEAAGNFEILAYCKPHIDNMWAARVVGIILNCDFKDSKQELKKLELGEVLK